MTSNPVQSADRGRSSVMQVSTGTVLSDNNRASMSTGMFLSDTLKRSTGTVLSDTLKRSTGTVLSDTLKRSTGTVLFDNYQSTGTVLSDTLKRSTGTVLFDNYQPTGTVLSDTLKSCQGEPSPRTTMTKKQDLLSVAVYLVICFTLMLVFGPLIYEAEQGVDYGAYQMVYVLAAFSPCIACLVTRLLFREGFNGLLFPKFTGHFKAYFLSVVLPIVFGILNCIFITVSTGAGFSFKLEGGIFTALGNNMFMSVYAYYVMIIIIGEELGWRAFLYDKLEKLFGLNGAVVIGGIIWGLWHIPPIVHAGLNFGKNYPGFPYVGIALMCVMCIGFGATMQLLRKMSDSVIAPIIAHAIIDSVCNTLATMFLTEEIIQDTNGSIKFIIGVCCTVSSLIVGIPCWIALNKRVNGDGSR